GRGDRTLGDFRAAFSGPPMVGVAIPVAHGNPGAAGRAFLYPAVLKPAETRRPGPLLLQPGALLFPLSGHGRQPLPLPGAAGADGGRGRGAPSDPDGHVGGGGPPPAADADLQRLPVSGVPGQGRRRSLRGVVLRASPPNLFFKFKVKVKTKFKGSL